jgi:uncharacterized protein
MIGFFIASSCLGAIAGVSAGLFGIGGGLIIVPVLAWLLIQQNFNAEQAMITAVATSLASIITTSISSVLAHHKRGYILWERLRYLSIGVILGAIVGALIAEKISGEHLRLIFALFLFYVALQIGLQISNTETDNSENLADAGFTDYLAGLGIGLASAILGVGGGTLTVPYLLKRKVPMKNAVALASACGFPIALTGTTSYILLGIKQPNLPEWSLGYIYLPAFFAISLSSFFTAPVGAKLAHILPAQQLKRYFSLVLLLLAIKMLWY